MGGSSKSSSKSSQTTTTRDERIAATDNAVVLRDSLNQLENINITDGGAIEAISKISLAVLEGAGNVVDQVSANSNNASDKVLEYISSKEEDATTSNWQKSLPWLVACVSIYAISKRW